MTKFFITLALCAAFFVAAPAYAANGTISGTVTRASTGAPFPSAYVYAQNVSTLIYNYASAGNDGSYSVSVTPGTYDLWVSSILTDSTISIIKRVVTVTVGDGETKSGQNLALIQRAKFIGHVYQLDGVTPISGAFVSVVSAAGSANGAASTITSSNGSYNLSPAPADTTASGTGIYVFTSSRAGYFSTSFANVPLPADESAVTQDIRLGPASTISGTITDTNGVGISYATVTYTKVVNGTPFGIGYSATTNASGAYTVSIYDVSNTNGTAIADYAVTISKLGYVTKAGTYSITADGTNADIGSSALTSGKILSGTVMSGNGGALSFATISLYRRNKARSGTPDFTTTTASDGTYSFNSIPNGNYRILITRIGHANLVVDSLAITNDITAKVYTLIPAGTITGLVFTGKNIPVDGATVAVFAMNKGKAVAYTTVTAGDTGQYTINGLRAGSYRLRVVSADFVTQVVTVAIKAGKITSKNVKLATAGSIEGYVIDKVTQLPIFGAVVRVSGTSATASSDTNGYYALDGIAPGKINVTATISTYDVPKLTPVTVAAGKVQTVNFTLAPKQ